MSLASSSFAGQALVFKSSTQRQPKINQLQIVAKESRIGKQPIAIPDKVQVTLDGNVVKVKVYSCIEMISTFLICILYISSCAVIMNDCHHSM